MACRGQAVAAHTTVVALLISGLSVRGQTDNDIATLNVFVVDHIRTFHTTGHGAIHDDRAYQVAHVGCLSTSGVAAYPHLTQLSQQLVCPIDDSGDHLARHQELVASDRGRDQDVIHCAHAEQVVDVHDQGILRDAFPYREIAGLFPIHVGQRRLRACAIGVHDITKIWITT